MENQRLPSNLLISAAGLVLMAFSGCTTSEEIDSTYGKISGMTRGAPSVNGLSVLAEMFEASGSKTRSWRRLSPKLEECDTLVWAPDDVDPPTAEQIEFLEDWLWNQDGRTLVYICRDFDAAVMYWQQVAAGAPPEDTVEIQRRLATARARHDVLRAKMLPTAECRWFRLQRDGRKRKVRSLLAKTGNRRWTQGLVASKSEIEIETRVLPPTGQADDLPNFEPMLTSNEDVLVARITSNAWQDSQILLVVNGSFLFNAALVNHEHRKLAGALIDECRPAAQVCFLESGSDGLEIFHTEPGANYRTGIEPLQYWPMAPITLHMIAWAFVLSMSLFPIFGRPKHLPPDDYADFGKHVAALGGLLERTGDLTYAQQRIHYYLDHVRRESGVSHLKSTNK